MLKRGTVALVDFNSLLECEDGRPHWNEYLEGYLRDVASMVSKVVFLFWPSECEDCPRKPVSECALGFLQSKSEKTPRFWMMVDREDPKPLWEISNWVSTHISSAILVTTRSQDITFADQAGVRRVLFVDHNGPLAMMM